MEYLHQIQQQNTTDIIYSLSPPHFLETDLSCKLIIAWFFTRNLIISSVDVDWNKCPENATKFLAFCFNYWFYSHLGWTNVTSMHLCNYTSHKLSSTLPSSKGFLLVILGVETCWLPSLDLSTACRKTPVR